MSNEKTVIQTFQVNKSNGDIDFISVEDLPVNAAKKFVESKYPNVLSIEFLETSIKTNDNV